MRRLMHAQHSESHDQRPYHATLSQGAVTWASQEGLMSRSSPVGPRWERTDDIPYDANDGALSLTNVRLAD